MITVNLYFIAQLEVEGSIKSYKNLEKNFSDIYKLFLMYSGMLGAIWIFITILNKSNTVREIYNYLKNQKKIISKTIIVILCVYIFLYKISRFSELTNNAEGIFFVTIVFIVGIMTIDSLYRDVQGLDHIKYKINNYIKISKKMILVLGTMNALVMLFNNLK